MQASRLVRVLTLCKADIMGTLRNAKIVILEMESPYHHLMLALDS
jgi:hypothetical protein